MGRSFPCLLNVTPARRTAGPRFDMDPSKLSKKKASTGEAFPFASRYLPTFKRSCRQNRSHRRPFGFLDFRLAFFLRLPEVVLALHAQPYFGAVADPLAYAKRHLGSDG